MNEMLSIVGILVAAILSENFILVKFYGICPFMGVSKKIDTALGMGMAVTFVMGIASVACWAVNELILMPLNLGFMQTVAFILVIASLVQLIEMFLRKFVPALYTALGIYLPLITTNCAVLGAALLNIQNGYSFGYSVAFGFFGAVGFTLAIVVFAGVRLRLRFAEPPKSFEGMPLALVAAGIVAMAFSAFSGIRF